MPILGYLVGTALEKTANAVMDNHTFKRPCQYCEEEVAIKGKEVFELIEQYGDPVSDLLVPACDTCKSFLLAAIAEAQIKGI